jgi:hypothetical protein
VTQDREQPFSIDRTWTSDPDPSPSPSQDVDKPIDNRTLRNARSGRPDSATTSSQNPRTNGRFVFGARGYRDSIEEQQLGAIRTCGSTVGFL